MKVTRMVGILMLAVVAAHVHGAESAITVEDERYAVTWDTADACFRIRAKVPDLLMLPELRCAITQPQAMLPTEREIEVVGPEGSLRVSLLPECPFIVVSGAIRNSGTETESISEYTPLQGRIQLDTPTSELRILGTGGLVTTEKGSETYTFAAVVVPGSRNGVVAAWLTQDRGNGIFKLKQESGSLHVRAQIDYGALQLEPGVPQPVETLLLGYFDDARAGLEAYADHVAACYKIQLSPIPCGYCTWYSQPYGGASDAKHLVELAQFAKQTLQPFGLDFIQIDDMWQGFPRDRRELDRHGHMDDYLGKLPGEQKERWWWGPYSDFTQHNPKGPYRAGMAPSALQLSDLGFTPGLWFMPFAWDPLCDALADHHDYFLKREDGALCYTEWAGWCLDMSHPDARGFLSTAISRMTNEWGFRYLKLDGLWTATGAKQVYVNDAYVLDQLGEAVGHDRTQTPIERYRSGLALVREAAGPDVFLLGCNVSQNMRTLGASFGLVDAMRIGPDNGPGWNELKAGPWHGSNRYFLHGRVWHNDPDPVYVRESMPIAHARLLCSWVALTGQLTVMSDWLPELPAERLEILKRILPNHGLKPRPVDLFDHELPRIWILTDTRGETRRDVLGFFNWNEDEACRIEETAARLGLPDAKTYAGFDFWASKAIEPFSDRLAIDVPAGSCRLIAVRPTIDRPFVISTNRHISQGIVEVKEETWDENANSLSGRSRVVAGDPYELRIVAPFYTTGARAEEISVDCGDPEPRLQQEGDDVRATFISPTSGEVFWQIRFKMEKATNFSLQK